MTGSYDIKPDPTPRRKDKGVKEFFEKLGYEVGWDHNRSGYWYELYDEDEGMVAQVDWNVPLEVIVEDMIAWHLGKEPEDRPDKPDWVCSGPEGLAMKELFKRVYDYQVTKTLPNGQKEFGIK